MKCWSISRVELGLGFGLGFGFGLEALPGTEETEKVETRTTAKMNHFRIPTETRGYIGEHRTERDTLNTVITPFDTTRCVGHERLFFVS